MEYVMNYRALVNLLAGALALTFLGSITSAVASDMIETELVEEKEAEDIRLFDGVVEAINLSTLSSQTSGRITEVNFDVDDFVEAGAIIVRFSDTEHKAGLEQAQGALNGAIAARDRSEEDFKRIEQLFQNGTVARARFDAVKSAFEVAKSQVKSAEAAVEKAKEQLSYTIVRAPYSGFVVKRHVQNGETANPGQPLMTGFSLNNLRVKVDVPQQFAPFIRKNNQAEIYSEADEPIKAESLTVFPYADAQSNTVTIRANLPEKTKQVFPGMLVKIAFKIGERRSLSISEESIYRKGEVRGVYLVRSDGSIVLQQVRTGRSHKGQVEILSGLKPGDKIATDPFKALLKLKAGE